MREPVPVFFDCCLMRFQRIWSKNRSCNILLSDTVGVHPKLTFDLVNLSNLSH